MSGKEPPNKESGRPAIGEVAHVRHDLPPGWALPGGVVPPTDPTLISIGGRLDLYEWAAGDDRVLSTMQQRGQAVVSREWKVEPGGSARQDRKAADSLREMLANISFDDVSKQMLWGLFYGFSIGECIYEVTKNEVWLSDVLVRKQRRFAFDANRNLCLKTPNSINNERMPERKFWHFACHADHGDDPYGRGLGSWAYWPVHFKRDGVRAWADFLNKFANPVPLLQYDEFLSDADRQKLLAVAANANAARAVLMPKGNDLSFLEASRSGTVDYINLVEYMDRAITRIVLSQTMTTEDGSSRSQATVHLGVRDEVVKGDADMLCNSFARQVGRWLTEWNYSGAAIPRVWRDVDGDPLRTRQAERDHKLYIMGLRPTQDYVSDTYGEGWVAPATEEASTEERPAMVPATPADHAEPAEGAEMLPANAFLARYGQPARVAVDTALGAWVEAVRDILAGAGTLEEAAAALSLPILTLQPMRQALGQAFLLADLAGRASVPLPEPARAYAGDPPDPPLSMKEAVDFFAAKVRLPTATWTDLRRGQHVRGFVVAGAMQDALLEDFQSAIRKALTEGTTLEAFRKDFDRIVAEYGWEYKGGRNWRSAVIYNTNLRTAFMAGRYKQAKSSAALAYYPAWQYRHSDLSLRPREEHLDWDGLVLPPGDAFWKTHGPPNGWGCNCDFKLLSRRDLAAAGRLLPDGSIRFDPSPEIKWEPFSVGGGAWEGLKPKGIDPGWDYNVGEAAWGRPLVQQAAASAAPREKFAIKEDWKALGLPEKPPTSTAPVGSPAQSSEEAVAQLSAVLGGPQKAFAVPGAGPVLVEAEFLASHVAADTGRTMYFPSIPALLESPTEVWQCWEIDGAGRVQLRRYIIKVITTPAEKERAMVLVAQAHKGVFVGWTMFPISRWREVQRMRAGTLLHTGYPTSAEAAGSREPADRMIDEG